MDCGSANRLVCDTMPFGDELVSLRDTFQGGAPLDVSPAMWHAFPSNLASPARLHTVAWGGRTTACSQLKVTRRAVLQLKVTSTTGMKSTSEIRKDAFRASYGPPRTLVNKFTSVSAGKTLSCEWTTKPTLSR